MAQSSFVFGLSDVVAAMRRLSLGCLLGWQDIRQRYRRSSLGPFWLTLSMGIMIGTMGVVFGRIFKSPLDEFFPYLSIGLILWSYISSVVTEGCLAFTSADSIIKQLPIPLFVHVIRVIWRATIILSHNLLIVPVVLLVSGRSISFSAFLAIPGLVLIILNLAWISLLLATICARYRDLPQIVNSIQQVAFYVTPIMWMPRLLEGRAEFYLISINPLYHLIEIVRSPLMGDLPTATTWAFLSIIAIVGWGLTLALYGKYRARVAYWL